MVNNKLIAIDEETRKILETYKIHPREPVGDVVKKIVDKYKEMVNKLGSPASIPKVEPTVPTPSPNTANVTPARSDPGTTDVKPSKVNITE